MTDAKEWVTIKIPKPIREDASDDPRTYGEIMQAGLSNDEPPEDFGLVRSATALEESESEIDLTPVLNRIDDLETELPRKVAEEVHSR